MAAAGEPELFFGEGGEQALVYGQSAAEGLIAGQGLQFDGRAGAAAGQDLGIDQTETLARIRGAGQVGNVKGPEQIVVGILLGTGAKEFALSRLPGP